VQIGRNVRFNGVCAEVWPADQHIAKEHRKAAIRISIQRQLASENLRIGIAFTQRLAHLCILGCQLNRQTNRKQCSKAEAARPPPFLGGIVSAGREKRPGALEPGKATRRQIDGHIAGAGQTPGVGQGPLLVESRGCSAGKTSWYLIQGPAARRKKAFAQSRAQTVGALRIQPLIQKGAQSLG